MGVTLLLICMAMPTCQGCELTPGGGDGTSSTTPAKDTKTPPTGRRRSYIFVKVEDQTSGQTCEDHGVSSPGADIDAVELIKGSGSNHVEKAKVFKAVLGCAHNDLTTTEGPPDASSETRDDCADTGYLSLGGGYVIVRMGVPIDPGDTIVIHEVGACSDKGSVFDDDPYKVSVSVADDDSQPWQPLFAGTASGTVSVTVPALPVIPVN